MSSGSPDVVLYDGSSNALAVQNGSATPANTPALMIAGSDGTNSRFITVDGSGRVTLVGAGVAGTPAGGVLTIQGVSGGTVVPVSGTVTSNIGTTNGLALDTSVNGLLVAQGSTTSGQKGTLTLGAVTTAAPSYTTAQTSPLSLTTTGLLRIDGSGVTQPVSGSVTANQGGAPWSENITQFGGVALSTGTGASGTGIPRVTVANDSNILATQSGTWTVQPGNTANTTPWLVTNQVLDVTSTGTLGALNATTQITLAGHTTAGFQLAAGTLIGTIVAEVSFDAGTTWNATYIDNGNRVSSVVFASSNTATAGSIVGNGGSGLARIRVSAYTSGTANITLRTSVVNDPSTNHGGLVNATVQPPDATQIAGWDGTTLRVPAVKAPSTAPVATDQALVVVASPNQAAINVTVTGAASSTPNLVFGDITLSSNANTVQINRTTYTEQTTNFTGSVKSSSANDAAAGTGARTMTIYYVDQTGATAGTESVTLNGTTAVNLVTTTKCFIEKIIINTVGTGLVSAGTISLFTGTGGTGTTVGTIQAGDNRTYWCHHYVVTGKTCNVTNLSHSNTSTVSGGNSTGHIRSQTLNSANSAETQVSEFIDVPGAGAPSLKAYVATIQIPGPARIAMYVLPGANTSTIYRGSIDCYDQ